MKISKTIWSGWKEEALEMVFPDEWKITDYYLNDKKKLPKDTIYRILDIAIEKNLDFNIAKSSKKVCILVDDITRPTCWEIVLDFMIEKLIEKGIKEKNIDVLISLAGHGKLTKDELAMKIGGKNFERVKIYQHEFHSDLVWMNHDGKKVGLNKIYCRADFKLALGTLIPHPFAGFSGGGKAVMPGIADRDTIRNNHFLVAFGKGKVFDTNNYIRNQMDSVAIQSGLNVLINAICNGRREIIDLFAGPPCETYKKGVRIAQKYSAMKVEELHDVIILNAYPKDQELVQINNSLNVYRTLPENVKLQCRTIVILAKLSKGLGYHAIFGPGGSLYKPPKLLSFIDGRDLIVFSPKFNVHEFHKIFAKEYKLVNEWNQIIQEIECLALKRHNVGIFHQASMQTANG